MKRVSIAEAKNHLSALLDRVKNDDTILITDRGRPVARLEPVLVSNMDDEERVKQLQRQGIIRRGRLLRRPNPLILTPPPKGPEGESIVDVLIEQRRSGR